MAGTLNFMSDRSRGQVAGWARVRAKALHKELKLPESGSPARLASIAHALTAAYELGYLRRVKYERRRAVPL